METLGQSSISWNLLKLLENCCTRSMSTVTNGWCRSTPSPKIKIWLVLFRYNAPHVPLCSTLLSKTYLNLQWLNKTWTIPKNILNWTCSMVKSPNNWWYQHSGNTKNTTMLGYIRKYEKFSMKMDKFLLLTICQCYLFYNFILYFLNS